MSGRDYPRLDIETFGRHLLVSGDLDPVYIALKKVDWKEGQLERWLIAYWSCYHCGASSYLSEHEGDMFWDRLLVAAENTVATPLGGRWPRAPERRHWRGDNAIKSVEDLMGKYPGRPEQMVWGIANDTVQSDPSATSPMLTYTTVAKRVMSHVGFGPWIAFKVADMLERVMDVEVQFSLSDVLYEDPEEAAVRVWLAKSGQPPGSVPKDRRAAVERVVIHLISEFGAFDAPPGGGRKVGIQEVETILCKWKSHQNGHYPLDNDLTEIRAGTSSWAAISPTATEFLHYLPLPGQREGIAA